MSFRKLYQYFFYKLYKFSEAAPSRWLSDWKAGLAVDVLVFFVLFSLVIYYKVFFNRHLHLSKMNLEIVVFILLIGIPNYFIFHHNDQWKVIVHEFDKFPKRKNKIGGWIVFIIVLMIIANLIFAFYQMSKIDWKLY